MQLPYNPRDKTSVLEYARRLKNKSLRQACLPAVKNHGYSGKGNFGQILEKYYFGYEPNSNPEADFAKIGMELKSTPLKKLKNGEFRSKERLVLSIIDFFKIPEEDFESSEFWKKNANLLLVFYLYEKGVGPLDYIIKLVDEWSFPDEDLKIIKKDWESIQSKIRSGKAHELSEGDTFYLGACTKGSTAAKSMRDQPFNTKKAKQRAYSLKSGYVNHIIARLSEGEKETYGKIIQQAKILERETLEDIVLSKFRPYYGKTPEEIEIDLGLDLNKKAKSYFANLTKAILGIELDKKIEEFEKAEIVVKTVRLKENDLPKEDMSFPSFRYTELINEKWEKSAFKETFEHKFLIVFYQYKESLLVLRKVRFWTMPFKDLKEAKKVWRKTKEVIKNGQIVRKVKNGRNYTNFPDKKFNKIASVRPHARDRKDVYPLPIPDNLTGLTEYTKHCFWLNNSYIRDEIFLED